MKDGRLSLRLNSELVDRIKRYASKHGITVTDLVARYFKQLLEEEKKEDLKYDAEQI